MRLATMAMARNPLNAKVLDTYGWALVKAQRYDEAIQSLGFSVRIEPMSVNRYHLGRAFELTRAFAKALAEYDKALVLDRVKPDQHLQKDINQAIERVRRHVKSGKE